FCANAPGKVFASAMAPPPKTCKPVPGARLSANCPSSRNSTWPDTSSSSGIWSAYAVSMELLFERFLSEERGEWPDIDLDLPSGDEREKVIQYVYQRYGERGAA